MHLAAFRVLTEQPGQLQQATGHLQGHVFGLGAPRQRSPLGLGGLLAGLAALHVGAVLAKQQIDRLTGGGIFAQAFRAIGLLLEQQFRLITVEISRRQVLGQGGLDQLLFAVFPGALGLQIGTKPADSHHTGQAIELDRAGGHRIDIPLALGHLLLQALVAAEEVIEVGKPLR